jgi:hypothetical protein
MSVERPFSEVSISKDDIDAFRKRHELSQKEFTYLLGYHRNVWSRKIAEKLIIQKPADLILSIKRVLHIEKVDKPYLEEEVLKAKEYVKLNWSSYN